MMQVPEPIRRFWRETIAPRPIAAGSAAAVAAGLVVGGFLAAGAGFEPPPPMQPVPRALRKAEPAPQPITFMKDANGRSPDWVVGTDNIPGRETWRDRLPVATVTDPEDEADAPRRRGLGWLLQPWRWGRGEGRALEPSRPSRRMESDREADRRAERAQDRYDRYVDVEEERRQPQPRYEPDYRGRYAPRAAPQYEPRDAESEEAPYPFEQPPPPPERWRNGR